MPTSEDLLGSWLTFANHAAATPTSGAPGSAEWDAHTNALIAGFTVAALLGEMRQADPEWADQVADRIQASLDDSGATFGLLYDWSQKFNHGLPVGILDAGEHTPAETGALLNHLAAHDQATASGLWQRYLDKGLTRHELHHAVIEKLKTTGAGER